MGKGTPSKPLRSSSVSPPPPIPQATGKESATSQLRRIGTLRSVGPSGIVHRPPRSRLCSGRPPPGDRCTPSLYSLIVNRGIVPGFHRSQTWSILLSWVITLCPVIGIFFLIGPFRNGSPMVRSTRILAERDKRSRGIILGIGVGRRKSNFVSSSLSTVWITRRDRLLRDLASRQRIRLVSG